MPRTKTFSPSSSQIALLGQQKGKLPVAHESEEAALGAAIGHPESTELILSELVQEDFCSAKHQQLFRAIKSLSEENLTCNPVSVSERSGIQRSELDDIVQTGSGVSYKDLQTIVADVARVSGLRRVYEACVSCVGQVNKSSKLEDIMEALEKSLYKANRDGSNEAADGSDVLRAVSEDFLERQRNGGGVEISTGLKALDRAIVGLRPGKMGVIAARPSMGKTALASTIRRAVLAQGFGVIEFNLEMSKEELLERELAYQAQIGLTKVLRAKDVSDEELSRVTSAGRAGVQGHWYVDDRTYSIAGVRRKARILSGRMARKGVRTGLVVLDYIQLAGDFGDGSGSGREQSVAAISRGCKFLAKELSCTVLALSQLNRSCEYRGDRRPMMSDLRESGSIEQDADWVGFVYREHMYDNTAPPEETEFIIRKQRSGPVGTVHLKYNPKMVCFSDRDLKPTMPLAAGDN